MDTHLWKVVQGTNSTCILNTGCMQNTEGEVYIYIYNQSTSSYHPLHPPPQQNPPFIGAAAKKCSKHICGFFLSQLKHFCNFADGLRFRWPRQLKRETWPCVGSQAEKSQNCSVCKPKKQRSETCHVYLIRLLCKTLK